ncbi:hypothetical protein ACJJTC_006403 [Scirpophaga incertulas]
MISRIVLLFAFISFACAATIMEYLPPKPAELSHKQGCYVDAVKDVIPFGESVTPLGSCVRIDCSKRMIFYDTCGVVSTEDPDCYITEENLTKPYPDCCPDVKCITENQL